MAGLYKIYQCPTCRTARRFTADAAYEPICTSCACPMVWKRTTTLVDPPAPRFGQAPGIDFRTTSPIHVPIGPNGMTFDSLHALRRFEAESQALAADGAGVPHIIRGYSQDRSNMHVHTLGENPDMRPDLSRTLRDGTPRVRITSVDAPTLDDGVELGPGMHEAGASALPSDPV